MTSWFIVQRSRGRHYGSMNGYFIAILLENDTSLKILTTDIE